MSHMINFPGSRASICAEQPILASHHWRVCCMAHVLLPLHGSTLSVEVPALSNMPGKACAYAAATCACMGCKTEACWQLNIWKGLRYDLHMVNASLYGQRMGGKEGSGLTQSTGSAVAGGLCCLLTEPCTDSSTTMQCRTGAWAASMMSSSYSSRPARMKRRPLSGQPLDSRICGGQNSL